MASDAQALLLTVSADTSKAVKALDALNRKLEGMSPELERRAKRAASKVESAFGNINFGKAFERVLDSSRLAVLDEGSAKLRIFGSALEPLGPLGLSAAAGIGALAIALEEAHKAIEFADAIEKAAKAAHVTTDAVQEMQFAIREAGGESSAASPALLAFSEVLGKAEAGLPRALRAFQELFGKAFTAADAQRLAQSGHALQTVIAAIAQLRDASQKDAVISQFGLEGLRQLIEEGPDRIRELTAAAHTAGNVMDASLVKKGAELNRELETVTGKIKVDMAEAFVALAPILIRLLTFIGQMADGAERVAAAFAPLESRSTRVLEAERRGFVARQQNGGIIGGLTASHDRERIAQIDRELAIRAKQQAAAPTPPGGRDLFDVGKHTATRDDSKQRLDQADAALAQANRGLLLALAALTENIDERAKFEIAALGAESAAEKARLQKEIDTVEADKGIKDAAVRATIVAELKLAQAKVDQAETAKKQKILADASFASDQQYFTTQKTIAGYVDQIVDAQQANAATEKGRTAIARKTLLDHQRLDKIINEEILAHQLATGKISGSDAAAQRSAFDAAQAAQRELFDIAHEGPIKRYIRNVHDLDNEFQNAGVRAINDLSDGLADAIVNAKSLGDVASNVFKQLIAQLIAASSKQLIADVLAFIPGFASGTDFAPGGLSLVGERGPELVNLPRGAQVIPSDRTLSMIKSMTPPQRNVSVTVVQPFHFHAENAVLTPELMAEFKQYADRQAARAYGGARRDARRDQAGISYANHLNG